MIEFHTTAGQLLSWLLAQSKEEGLFPPAKAWEMTIQIKKIQASLFYVLTAKGEEMQINFVLLESKDLFPFRNDKLKQLGKGEWIVFCSQRLGREVAEKAELHSIKLLSLYSGGAKFLNGAFENKRLEFRLLQLEKSKAKAFAYPQPFGSNPSLHLEGEEALSWQQPFWQALTEAIITQPTKKVSVKNLLKNAISLWPLLPKGEKKKLEVSALAVINELMPRFFAGLLVVDTKGEGSEISFLFDQSDKKAMHLWQKAIMQAMKWTRVEQPQLEFSSLFPELD
ncbi:MAG: hypothetical protein QNL04_04060 [SAR324 cluster bacterium]|nr:hypothetical protein [SAR324 cluster bacterium]